jgi:predicted RNA-binding Zn-ribbon protein involved in translation (DUF1610 family)
LQSVKEDLRLALSQLSGTTFSAKTSRVPKKEKVALPCPACKALIAYRQKPSVTSFKTLECNECKTKLISRFRAGEGFAIEVRAPKSESVACPDCGATAEVLLNPTPGSSTTVQCKSCAKSLRVSRTPTGVTVKSIQAASDRPVSAAVGSIDEEFLNAVRTSMPPQPWPTGTGKEIAKKLGASPSEVSRATSELIRRGIFKPQIDGVVYEPVPLADGSHEAGGGSR